MDIKTMYDRLGKKELAWIVLVFILSSAATLVNPYGFHVYREVFFTLFNAYGVIGEWVEVHDPITFILIFVVMIITLLRYKKIPFEVLSVTCITCIVAIFINKFIPLFFILAAYPLSLAVEDFYDHPARSSKIGSIILRVSEKPAWFYVGVIIILIGIMGTSLARKSDMSVEAIRYLKTNISSGDRIFNDWAYGGYIIKEMPGQQVFIDGRMASWRQGEKYLSRDYSKLMSDCDNSLQLLSKYNIDWIIIANTKYGKRLRNKLENSSDWEKVFDDGIATVFKHK